MHRRSDWPEMSGDVREELQQFCATQCWPITSQKGQRGLGRAGSNGGRSISSAVCRTAAQQQLLVMAVASSRYFVGAAGCGLSASRVRTRPRRAVPLLRVEKASMSRWENA